MCDEEEETVGHSRNSTARFKFPEEETNLYPQGFHRDASIEWSDLLQQICIHFRVGDVAGEIGAASVGARLFQLEVDPAEENGFGREFHQLFNSLIVAQQVGQAWAVFQGDLIKQPNLSKFKKQN